MLHSTVTVVVIVICGQRILVLTQARGFLTGGWLCLSGSLLWPNAENTFLIGT